MITPPLLSVQDLWVRFKTIAGDRDVLKGLSFALEKGQTLALVGESGSGKSVAALSILGLLPVGIAHNPHGRIVFQGQDLCALSDDHMRLFRGRRIAMIFQEPMTALNPLQTARTQIDEVIKTHFPAGAPPRTVQDLLALVGLNPAIHGNAYPHQLSGGQRQRVVIAIALAGSPDILIADEPTTALDVTTASQILALLQDIQTQMGMAIVLITHDLRLVRRMADHMVVLEKGMMVESGPTDQVLSTPVHPYTRALITAEPSGRPVPIPDDAPVLLNAKDVIVDFPRPRLSLFQKQSPFRAVDSVSVKVRRGETIGIVGESGSGKTTLALAILRLIESKGSLYFDGRNMGDFSRAHMRHMRARLQVVFQDPFGSLSPRMTASQIVGEGLTVHCPHLTPDLIQNQIDHILREVGLDGAMGTRYPHEFSGGQRQRLSLARALILKPDLIVLDEPTSALDRPIQGEMIALLRSLQQKYGVSYLFISHDLKVVRALSHGIIVMKDGALVESGDADTLFDDPQMPYTKALLAAAMGEEF